MKVKLPIILEHDEEDQTSEELSLLAYCRRSHDTNINTG